MGWDLCSWQTASLCPAPGCHDQRQRRVGTLDIYFNIAMDEYEYLHYISNISTPGFSGHNVDGGLPLPDVACLSRDQDTAALDLGLSKELDALFQNFLSVETLTEFKL